MKRYAVSQSHAVPNPTAPEGQELHMSQICPMCHAEQDEPRLLKTYLPDGTERPERPKLSRGKRTRMGQTRSQRWNDAIADARLAIEDAQDCERIIELCVTERNRSEGRDALFTLRDAMDRTHEAFSALETLQDEYREWLDNMPESLQSSPTADLLQEIVGLDLSPCLSMDEAERIFATLGTLKEDEMCEEIDCGFRDADGMVDECEGVTLPRGFGRD